jgi:hypothetical protein
MELKVAKRKVLETLSRSAGIYVNFPINEYERDWKIDFQLIRSALVLLEKKGCLKMRKFADRLPGGIGYDSYSDSDGRFFYTDNFEVKLLPEGLELLETMTEQAREQMLKVFPRHRDSQPRSVQTVINNSGTMQYAPGDGNSQTISIQNTALYSELERRVASSEMSAEEKKSFLSKAGEVLNHPLTVAALSQLFK